MLFFKKSKPIEVIVKSPKDPDRLVWLIDTKGIEDKIIIKTSQDVVCCIKRADTYRVVSSNEIDVKNEIGQRYLFYIYKQNTFPIYINDVSKRINVKIADIEKILNMCSPKNNINIQDIEDKLNEKRLFGNLEDINNIKDREKELEKFGLIETNME